MTSQAILLSRIELQGASDGPSIGAGHEGFLVKLNSVGQIDSSFLPTGPGDHGALAGLGDDDHTQYYNQTRGDLRYSQLSILASTANGEGASTVSVEDTGGYFTSTNIEGALQEIGASGGTADHGALSGLGDDDHTQYHNNTRGDARYYTQTFLQSTSSNEGASKVGVEDAAGNYTGANVESILTELVSTTFYTRTFLNSTSASEGASKIGVQDSGGYFTSSEVEGALQELGSAGGGGLSFPIQFFDTGLTPYAQLDSDGTTVSDVTNPASARWGFNSTIGADDSGFLIVLEASIMSASFKIPADLNGHLGLCIYPAGYNPNSDSKYCGALYAEDRDTSIKPPVLYGGSGMVVLRPEGDTIDPLGVSVRIESAGDYLGDYAPVSLVFEHKTDNYEGWISLSSNIAGDLLTLDTNLSEVYYGNQLTLSLNGVEHSYDMHVATTSLPDINFHGSSPPLSKNSGHAVRVDRRSSFPSSIPSRIWHNDFKGMERFSGSNLQRFKMEPVQDGVISLSFSTTVTPSLTDVAIPILSSVLVENFFPIESFYYSIVGITITASTAVTTGSITAEAYIGSKLGLNATLAVADPLTNSTASSNVEDYPLFWYLGGGGALSTEHAAVIGAVVSSAAGLLPTSVDIYVTLEIQV